MLELPAVKDPFLAVVLPTAMLPNAILVGDTASWPAARPFPVRDTARFALPALLTIEREPFAVPPVVGENVSPSVRLCPAANTTGNVGTELMLNAVPVTV